MDKTSRITMIVLDSAGVGELPDADEFGDEGASTFAHIGEAVGGLNLPNMEKLGLGNITDIKGVKRVKEALGAYGKAAEKSKGKDTTTGHWEIAGIILDKPFPTYPDGFSKKVITEFEQLTGRKTMANIPASGTAIINDYGEHHLNTGDYIIYTSADPVFQIAAHEDLVPIEELYKACEIALEICSEKSPVARVIARPFIGDKKGNFTRTANRHDFSVKPPKDTVLDIVKESGLDVVGIGKINDIFTGEGITKNMGSNQDNKDGILKTIRALKEDTKGLIFTNLVDFDMKYGHRRDPLGYKKALEEFDSYLPEIYKNMRDDEILIITADHGCDPTYKGTDHTREYIPILVYGKGVKDTYLGKRESFADIAATIAKLMGMEWKETGKSFFEEIME